MGLNIQCTSEHLNKQKIKKMWQLIAGSYGHNKDTVTVQEVSAEQIQNLNKRYRGKDKATNILTFSYDKGEHDISLCLAIAKKESQQRNILMEEYVGMLLAHAFLHVVGMNHDNSTREQEMKQQENKFLRQAGFAAQHL